DPFLDGHRDFLRLARTVTDAALPVADDDQRRKGEVLSPLDDLGHPVDVHHAVDQLAPLGVALLFPLARCPGHPVAHWLLLLASLRTRDRPAGRPRPAP